MDSQLTDAFASGSLVRPSAGKADIVHLVRALAALTGVSRFHRPGPVQNLMDMIGPSDHYIFILIDGMGMNIVRTLPNTVFIASHLHRHILAISPGPPACALTSIATGGWP